MYRSNLKQTYELLKECKLKDQHKTLLAKTLFGLLFETLYNQRLSLENIHKNDNLIEKITRNYNLTRSAFMVGNKFVKMTAMDLQLIFGMPAGEIKIVPSRYTKTDSPFLNKFTYGPRDFSVAFLRSLVENEINNTDEESVRDVVRLLCLHLLATCFFTTTGQQVSKFLVRYVQDIDSMSKYNWPETIFTDLEKQVLNEHTPAQGL